jgi:DNA-binding transcriptional LysR family regulator
MFIAPLLPSFLERFPEVRIEIELSDGFTDLLAERIDLAVRITARVERGLEAVRLAPSRRILCASPAYLAAHGTPASIRDLAGHRCSPRAGNCRGGSAPTAGR